MIPLRELSSRPTNWKGPEMSADAIRQKVQRIVAEELGSVTVDKDGDVRVVHDSAVSFISVIEQENRTIVKIWSILAVEIPATPDFYQWIASEGQGYFFARMIASPPDEHGQAWVKWEYDLLGDYLDRDELLNAMHVVVGLSNDLDDEIVTKFGGRRWTDAD